jgi:DNA-binding GntR family transcriptional regulator
MQRHRGGESSSKLARDQQRVVHQQLRQAILTLELEPGLSIDEDELAARMNAGADALRKAVRELALEGLVEPSSPPGAVVINPMSLEDLEDLYSLRVVGEADAIWKTVPLLDPPACDRLAHELRLIDEHGNAPEGRAAHRRFHEGLRVGAGERRCRELSQLFEHAERYSLAAGRRKATTAPAEHRAILEACFFGERRLATDLLTSHVADTAYELVELQAPGRRTPSLDAAVRVLRERLDTLV